MPLSGQYIPLPCVPEITGEHLCALCAEQGGSCCATDPATGHLSFPLSVPEWRRLTPWSALATDAVPADNAAFEKSERDALHAAQKLAARPPQTAAAHSFPPANGDACCQVWPNTPDFILSMGALFPKEKDRVAELFPKKGSHFSLRLRQDGACVFLGQDGCRLPRYARPWYCLLFPVWMTEGRPGLFAAQGCLIASRATNPAHAVRLLDVDIALLREYFSHLRSDWGFAVTQATTRES